MLLIICHITLHFSYSIDPTWHTVTQYHNRSTPRLYHPKEIEPFLLDTGWLPGFLFISLHTLSIGFKSGLCPGNSITLTKPCFHETNIFTRFAL